MWSISYDHSYRCDVPGRELILCQVTRRGVDNQTKVMKRQNLQELLKQVQEGLQEDHHEEEDVKSMEDSVNHTPVHKPPKDEQSGVLKSGEWTEIVTDDWDNDFSIPPPAVLYGGVAKGKERSDTDTDDLDEIPATTMLKLRMAPSRLLQADDVMSHYSHQSRGSRATADRSNYSRSSRQHSLSPVRRVNPKVRKAPTIESIFQEEHQISLPTDR